MRGVDSTINTSVFFENEEFLDEWKSEQVVLQYARSFDFISSHEKVSHSQANPENGKNGKKLNARWQGMQQFYDIWIEISISYGNPKAIA